MTDEQMPQRRLLLLLTALGFAAGGWALFLWWQLLRARAGFEPVCLVGASGCGALWDGSMASWVQARTGLPVAAWGLVWGIAAAALPLRALSRRDGTAPGVSWAAASGLVGVFLLLGVSAQAGQFCGSCAVTYLVTGLYAVLALRGFGMPVASSGLATFAVTTGLAWLLLLYPGLRTPKNLSDAGRAALQADAAAPDAGADAGDHSHHDHEHPPIVIPEVRDDHPLRIATWPLDPAEQDLKLRTFLTSLDPRLQQAMADRLAEHRASPVYAVAPPRDLHGPADASTRIVDFTDTLCGHCAQFFVDIAFLSQLFPPQALSVDSRHYPLDGNCNASMPIQGPEQVRCFAARARICFEGRPEKQDFEIELYENQHGLTREQIYAAAAPHLDAAALDACADSPETAQKLASDVTDAARYQPQGTPLVLVGGRKSSALGPLLYAMILAGGDASHPAFDVLPAPAVAG
ncbi:MAG: thioredoxin domain-containing protein [Acidobacteriota bacterium]